MLTKGEYASYKAKYTKQAEDIPRKCHLSQPAPTIKGRRVGLPERLEALIDACLEPVAKKRLPTINAFLKRLDAVTEGAVVGQTVQAKALLFSEHGMHSLGGRLLRAGGDSQRTAVNWHLCDVDHGQPAWE